MLNIVDEGEEIQQICICLHTDSLSFMSFRELLSSDAMKDYNRARVYLDENYKSQEHFTVNFLLP